MLFADVETVFTETARTWGLAVGILIIAVVLLMYGWYRAGKAVSLVFTSWIKPRVDQIVDVHLDTVVKLRENSSEMVKLQASMDGKLNAVVETQKEISAVLKSIACVGRNDS